MGICVFGDSISQGYFDEKMGGWVNRMMLHLMPKHKIVYNFSVSGQSTKELLKRIEVEFNAAKPDPKIELVVFSIGDNDSYYINSPDKLNTPQEMFKDNLLKLYF